MKIIEVLSEHIEDELRDAQTYAKLALEYKETEPELSQLFFKLSGEEMTHMDALHKRVVMCIERYRQTHGEPPEGMRALYDFLHKREIAQAGEVKRLQELYREE